MSWGGARPAGIFARSMAAPRLRRHALFRELADRLLRLAEVEAHGAQHMRGLGELNIPVFNHLDAIAPRIEKIEERPRQEPPAGGLDAGAHARPVIDDEPEMTAPV